MSPTLRGWRLSRPPAICRPEPGRPFTPDRVLRSIEAKRKILAAVTARSHVYNDDDPWFSCPQAVVSDDPTPGSGCANETRANGPCDERPGPFRRDRGRRAVAV